MLAGMVWFAFAVELGDKTFAQHVDHISDTPEAQQLIEGTRATINPALDDVRDRMFGEYVEAPTYLSGETPDAPPRLRPPVDDADEVTPASTLRVHETDESLFEAEPARPGRRRSVYARDDDSNQDDASEHDDAAIAEPERPGRQRRPAAAITPAPREPKPAPREPAPREPTPAPREPAPARPRWLPGALVPAARIEPDEQASPPPALHELPRFMQPKPPPEPIVLHDLPLPRATIDDRRAAVRMLELVERTRASLPPRPPSAPTIPIVQPNFDPTLPELPSE